MILLADLELNRLFSFDSSKGVRSSSGDHPPVRVLTRASTSNAPHTSRRHSAALY